MAYRFIPSVMAIDAAFLLVAVLLGLASRARMVRVLTRVLAIYVTIEMFGHWYMERAVAWMWGQR